MTAPCGNNGKKPCRIPDRDRRRGTANSITAREAMPKCGAKSRQTGEPCANPVREAGKRCRLHGGATPSGRDWHRVQMPRPDLPPEKAARKLRTLRKRKAELVRRLAAMTPDERERYEARSAAMQPGTPVERYMRRKNREMRRLIEARLGPRPPTDPTKGE